MEIAIKTPVKKGPQDITSPGYSPKSPVSPLKGKGTQLVDEISPTLTTISATDSAYYSSGIGESVKTNRRKSETKSDVFKRWKNH